MDWEKVQTVVAAGFCDEPDGADADEPDEWWRTPNDLARVAVKQLRDGGFVVTDPADDPVGDAVRAFIAKVEENGYLDGAAADEFNALCAAVNADETEGLDQ